MFGLRGGRTQIRGLCSTPIRCAKAPNPYTNTILLPKTNFPLRADAAKREHLFRDRCTKDLYPWQVPLFFLQHRKLSFLDQPFFLCLVKKQSKRFIYSS